MIRTLFISLLILTGRPAFAQSTDTLLPQNNPKPKEKGYLFLQPELGIALGVREQRYHFYSGNLIRDYYLTPSQYINFFMGYGKKYFNIGIGTGYSKIHHTYKSFQFWKVLSHAEVRLIKKQELQCWLSVNAGYYQYSNWIYDETTYYLIDSFTVGSRITTVNHNDKINKTFLGEAGFSFKYHIKSFFAPYVNLSYQIKYHEGDPYQTIRKDLYIYKSLGLKAGITFYIN